MKNKRGNIYLGAIIGIVVFITGTLFLPFLEDTITPTYNFLDCTNVSISDGTKLSCLQIDLALPYFIWFFISLTAAILLGVNK